MPHNYCVRDCVVQFIIEPSDFLSDYLKPTTLDSR